MRFNILTLSAIALLIGGCDTGDDDRRRTGGPATDDRSVSVLASGSGELSPEELEAGRRDPSWRQYATADARERARMRAAGADTLPPGQDAAARPDGAGDPDRGGEARRAGEGGGGEQAWEDIAPETVNARPTALPIGGDAEGPAVARVQVLLDRVRFRPGVIDGRWGKNTEKAVYWFQNERGLDATGEVDRATLDRLEREADLGAEVVREHTLTEQDVRGPFIAIPDDIYERAELDCLCYRSLREKLGEVFHSAPEFLEQLNPDTDLNALSAGDRLTVPAVETFHPGELPDGKYTGGGRVARIVISDGGHYLHALDDSGAILYHFPSTLGADYAPSPTGDFTVQSITFDPTWHYQPELLTGVDPSKPDAVLPAGPNNDVGVVWMALSKPHYGIHGTKAPETIGYATSNGCVRLTNWDAGLLGQDIPEGVPVEFRDVTEE